MTEQPTNLLAPSLSTVLSSLVTLAVVVGGAVWLVRLVWRHRRLTRELESQRLEGRLQHLESKWQALETRTDLSNLDPPRPR